MVATSTVLMLMAELPESLPLIMVMRCSRGFLPTVNILHLPVSMMVTQKYLLYLQKAEYPERLTYTATLGRDDIGDRMGPNNLVIGWTPDGKDIIFRSRKQSFNAFRGQLFLVAKEGGEPREIPLTDGGFCSFSPDGNKLAFNWVFREFRTWKYYQGGMADDIRVFDYKTGEVEQLFNTTSQEIIPMWIGNRIFFLSDRDRTMNLICLRHRLKRDYKNYRLYRLRH